MDSWHVCWLVACGSRWRIRISHADTGANVRADRDYRMVVDGNRRGDRDGIVTGSVMLGLLRMAPERNGKIKYGVRNCEGA